MTCQHCRDHLPDYLDGSFDPDLQGEWRAHLEACPDCMHALQREQTIGRTLHAALSQAAAGLSLPPVARRAILRAAQEDAASASNRRRAWTWLAAAPWRSLAAAGVLAGVGITSLHVSRSARLRDAGPHAAARSDDVRFVLDVPFESDRHVGVSHAVFSDSP